MTDLRQIWNDAVFAVNNEQAKNRLSTRFFPLKGRSDGVVRKLRWISYLGTQGGPELDLIQSSRIPEDQVIIDVLVKAVNAAGWAENINLNVTLEDNDGVIYLSEGVVRAAARPELDATGNFYRQRLCILLQSPVQYTPFYMPWESVREQLPEDDIDLDGDLGQ